MVSIADMTAHYRQAFDDHQARVLAEATVQIEADLVRRELDCSVVNWWMDECAKSGAATYQTVRGAFTEGGAVYPGGLIFEKTHIQIAVRDPDCILGYFRPR
jgi:hypothetical protein